MRQDNTFSGTPKDILDVYSAKTEIGKRLRKNDAAQLLRQMRHAEAATEEREQSARECSDRIQQMNDAHRINMDYLLQFGVWASHRQQLLQILEDVENQGHMTLQEATQLAAGRMRTQQQLASLPQSLNGLDSGGSSSVSG